MHANYKAEFCLRSVTGTLKKKLSTSANKEIIKPLQKAGIQAFVRPTPFVLTLELLIEK